MPKQLTNLAGGIGLAVDGTIHLSTQRVLTELGRRTRWLLIFDNAEHPDDIAGYRPAGSGHVLVTSRFPGWGAMGGRVEIDVLKRSETVALLRGRLPEMTPDLADELSAELGDLPLAAAQAAGYLEQTGLPPAEYLRRFRTRRTELLAHGDVLDYHGRVDTTWALSLDRLRDANPAAVALLEAAAFLGAEPIPLSLFTQHPELLDEPLRTVAADPDALSDAVGDMVGYSLARRHPDGFQLHRLVQAVARNRIPAGRREHVANTTLALLVAAHPGDPDDPAHWAAYARIAPHILATNPLGDDQRAGRRLMIAAVGYISAHSAATGGVRADRQFTEKLLESWRTELGPDHPDTLRLAANLTFAWLWLGDAERAHALGEDTLRRSRTVLGANHRVTLFLAANLTYALAWLDREDQACELGQRALRAGRQHLGSDDSITLLAASGLAFALAWLNELPQAAALGQDTLDRARRTLGLSHPLTLISAANLMMVLGRLGDGERARDLGRDTLDRARRTLGAGHMITLIAGANLTFVLARLGDREHAPTLGQDTLNYARQTLGCDHRITLVVATGLLFALVAIDDDEQAAALHQDTVRRARRVLGPKHRITLTLEKALDSRVSDHPGRAPAVRNRSWSSGRRR